MKYSNGSHLGTILRLRDIWQCLQTFLVVTTWDMCMTVYLVFGG